MSLPSLFATRACACALLALASLSAQRVRAEPMLGALGTPAGPVAGDDPGRPVEMFENPNLDNYLRRARSLLERQDFTGAIELLQDVIEGETVEVVAVGDAESAAAGEAAPSAQQGEDASAGSSEALTARNAVFSVDGRIYRPVRRLCHELLAEMPDVGLELYRTAYEFTAEEMLAAAIASGSTVALEAVANRYFITLPAGRAMLLLADRLMHAGRYRGAVQVLRDLLAVYPEKNRERLGIREAWCGFKIALCLRLAGEPATARAAVAQLAADHAEESLRIAGQLESVREMPNGALFVRDTVAIEDGVAIGRDESWVDGEALALLPLWQYRFEERDPYRDPKPSKTNRGSIWIDNRGSRSTEMPIANRYGPATWVSFAEERRGGVLEPRALFLEHYRLRMTDAASGLLLQASDGPALPPKARENYPRVRIAAADHALLRPVEDEARRYVIIGYAGRSNASDAALRASELVAYEKRSWARSWSSVDWLEGDDGLRRVTFLAAPTVFGERLLAPAMRGDSYTLECLDRRTGKPLWHTPLHAGGTNFFKAPGTQVAVLGGVAYVATNAGCLAAVDAFAGDLRWIRRYERLDPTHGVQRGQQRSKRAASRGYGKQFTQAALESFEPADLILHGGSVVIAPCDGEVLMSIDVATGAPIWMLDTNTHHAPYGKLTQVIGAGAGRLFVASRSHVVGIDLDGGLVRWMEELPPWTGPKHSGRGRGAVVGSTVIVPNMRELLLYDVDNESPPRSVPLPPFDEGREPLQGAFNVAVQGPWLAVGYAGGVEVFSTQSALRALAAFVEEPLRRASYLSQSGDLVGAEQVLTDALQHSDALDDRVRFGRQLLAAVRARADLAWQRGGVDAALGALDSVRDLLNDRELRLEWHLARVELCKAAGDIRAHEIEQQSLYDYMEGRR